MEIKGWYLHVDVKKKEARTYLYCAKTKEWDFIEYGLITLPKYVKDSLLVYLANTIFCRGQHILKATYMYVFCEGLYNLSKRNKIMSQHTRQGWCLHMGESSRLFTYM